MQTRNPIFDEFAKLATGAVGVAQAAGEEAKAAMRAQADKFVADMDLVRKDELEALKAEIAALRTEVAALRSAGAKAPAAGTSTAKKPPKGAAG